MFNFIVDESDTGTSKVEVTKEFPYVFEIEFGHGDVGFSGRQFWNPQTGETTKHVVNLLRSNYGVKVNEDHTSEQYKELISDPTNQVARLTFTNIESVDAVMHILQCVKDSWDKHKKDSE